ncbi:MAG: peptidylprolyl isomerase [Sulfuricella sp.]|nr:peptidylprolyl isomerase [Sulfuricella sp.]
MFSYKSRIIAISIGSMLTLASCNAQDAAKPAAAPAAAGPAIATVNGTPISQAKFDFILKVNASRGQPDSPEVRKAIHEMLVNKELLLQAAVKKGMDKMPEIATQIELGREDILANAYLQDYVKTHPVGDDELKAEYEQIKAQMKAQMGDKEYHARHILVEKESEAKDILAKLKKGEKFEKLAEKSKDPGSKAKGGDLGWASPTNFVPEFSAAMTKLQKGQYTTTPVKSQFGWHVIKLDDVRTSEPPAFDEVKEKLRQRHQQQIVEKALTELKSQAKIEEPAQPAAPAGEKK